MKKTKKEPDYFLASVIIIGLFILTLLLIADILPYTVANERIAAAYAVQNPSTAPVAYSGRSHVVAIDQIIDDRLFVLSTALYRPGFVVVQKMEKDVPGEVIGVSHLLQSGLYSNRTITLTEKVISGKILYVSIYTDNGDGAFTMPDPANKTQNGDIHEPAMVELYVL